MEKISAKEIKELMDKAKKIFKDNFKMRTCFERAIFYSWHCDIRDCAFCYMSTQPKCYTQKNKNDKSVKLNIARRSTESLIAETILCRELGWDLGFFSGGIGAFSEKEFLTLLKKIHSAYRKKIWLNIGPLPKRLLTKYKPYTKGVVGSIEIINPLLHKKICPSKPIEPYEEMFEEAKKLKLKRAMTMIVGLGETKEDFILLKEFIKKYGISKIHIYGLNPQKGTIFENSSPPTKEQQAWWIAQTRIAFPKIDIQMGVWRDRTSRISYLLDAGANSISKFPIILGFGKKECKDMVRQATKAEREFKGHIMKLPKKNWEKIVASLDSEHFTKNEKTVIYDKLMRYVRRMEKTKTVSKTPKNHKA